MQTIKSRLQSAPHGTYSGFLDCARKTIAANGVKSLWKGFGPAMARAFPANVSYLSDMGVQRLIQITGRYVLGCRVVVEGNGQVVVMHVFNVLLHLDHWGYTRCTCRRTCTSFSRYSLRCAPSTLWLSRESKTYLAAVQGSAQARLDDASQAQHTVELRNGVERSRMLLLNYMRVSKRVR